jgi:hypothetical protein
VDGSHCGIGWNPRVFAIIADRLCQPENAWRPYAKSTPPKTAARATAAAARIAQRQPG